MNISCITQFFLIGIHRGFATVRIDLYLICNIERQQYICTDNQTCGIYLSFSGVGGGTSRIIMKLSQNDTNLVHEGMSINLS